MITVVNRRNHFGIGEYIGRPSPLGNPFVIGKDGTREQVIAAYREWLYERIPENENVTSELNRLWALSKQDDLNLICWCAPKECHGNVIKEVLEEDY